MRCFSQYPPIIPSYQCIEHSLSSLLSFSPPPLYSHICQNYPCFIVFIVLLLYIPLPFSLVLYLFLIGGGFRGGRGGRGGFRGERSERTERPSRQ